MLYENAIIWSGQERTWNPEIDARSTVLATSSSDAISLQDFAFSYAKKTETGSAERWTKDMAKDNLSDMSYCSPKNEDVADVALEQLISNEK